MPAAHVRPRLPSETPWWPVAVGRGRARTVPLPRFDSTRFEGHEESDVGSGVEYMP